MNVFFSFGDHSARWSIEIENAWEQIQSARDRFVCCVAGRQPSHSILSLTQAEFRVLLDSDPCSRAWEVANDLRLTGELDFTQFLARWLWVDRVVVEER